MQRGDLHHVSVHRRFNAGKRQIDFSGIQAGLVAGNLRINGADLRLLYRQLRRRLIQILARYRLQLRQRLIALQRHRRQPLFSLGLLQLSVQFAQRRLALADTVLRLLRIDHAK
ncbi:hypothetical protein D3C79_931930 [compost metagenome]